MRKKSSTITVSLHQPAPADVAINAITKKSQPIVKLKDVTRLPKSSTKQGILVSLLQAKQGATLAELVEATGWQPHSVRGVLSGVVKKKLGLNITSCSEERGRVYRIMDTQS